MSSTGLTCPHPLDSVSIAPGGMFMCHRCGAFSLFGTLEGRPLEDTIVAVDAYRQAHPETSVGTATVSCEACSTVYEITTTYACFVLVPIQQPPLRWESMIHAGDVELGPARYATASDARRGHDDLQVAARTHALCLRQQALEELLV